MLHRALVLSTLAAALSLAAVCGDPKPAQEQGDGGSDYKPQGQVAKLRLEVVEDSITCDGKTHEVRVWLDDLPREPVLSPDVAAQYASRGIPPEPPPSTGISAFQFKLRYNPAVVWVANKGDATLGAGLDDAPPATAIDRNFTTVAKLNNYEGYVFTGGVALGLTGDVALEDVPPTGLESPAGIDPLAGGAPIHLMTIALSPVGAGMAELTLDEALLYTADSAYSYAPVETTGGSITVGGECLKVDTPTPYPSATPWATTPTQAPGATTVPVTPSASQSVRPDCPATWAVGDESGFSFCYPTELRALRSSVGNTKVVYNVASPPAQDGSPPLDQVYLSIALQQTRSFGPTVGCRNVTVIPNVTEIREESITVDGRVSTACFSRGTDSLAGEVFDMEAIIADVEAGDGTFIAIVATNTGPHLAETRQLVEQILQTIRPK